MNEDICDDVLIALRRITRAIDIHSRKLMQTTGLTAPQLLILQILKRKDGNSIAMGELATSINLSQGTVTSILDRLIKKALVKKVRSTIDKRKVYVSLTDAGQDTLAQAPTLLQEHFISSFKELQDWEQTLILSSLQRVGQMMNAEQIDVAPILYDQPITTAEESAVVPSYEK